LPYTPNMKKRIAFIAGGTGVTPALQLVREVLSNSDDKVNLIFTFFPKCIFFY